MKKIFPYFIFIFCFLNFIQTHAAIEVADLVLINGNIWTVNSEHPKAQGIAIKKNQFLAVGSDEIVKQHIGKKTKVIDLKGKFVLPGFIDSHVHFLYGGFSLFDVQLREVKNKNEFISKIAQHAKRLKKGDWILNGNWDHQQFNAGILPRKEWIDPVTPDNPVSINRIDGHMVLANSKALQIAGITKDTPSPAGGKILKDPVTHEPTGILKDAAVKLINQHIPEPARKEKVVAAKAAIGHANALGVTSVHDMAYVTNMARYGAYLELLNKDALSVRLAVYIPIRKIDQIIKQEIPKSPNPNILKIAGVKGFIDGSLGSSTALFYEPYLNTKQTGVLFPDMIPENTMVNRLKKADEAGIQVAIHAIGDKANHKFLDILNEIKGQKDRRWRVEHAQHLLPSDIKKMAEHHIIASVQPYHLIDDAQWIENKLGKKRSKLAYPFASFKKAGVRLSCGSDWTVAPLSPIEGIYAAVTRKPLNNTNSEGWLPEQKISLKEAIKCFTLDGAYTEFADEKKGSIKHGKLADLVVLDKNLFAIPPEDIRKTKVLMTIFNGKIVYDNPN